MDVDRNSQVLELLMDVRERTATIEARGEARDAWQATTTTEIRQLQSDVRTISDCFSKLMAEINTAKTVVRVGGGLADRLLKLLGYSAAGGAGWLASLFLPPR